MEPACPRGQKPMGGSRRTPRILQVVSPAGSKKNRPRKRKGVRRPPHRLTTEADRWRGRPWKEPSRRSGDFENPRGHREADCAKRAAAPRGHLAELGSSPPFRAPFNLSQTVPFARKGSSTLARFVVFTDRPPPDRPSSGFYDT
ncbi:MAG: hypothetical protein BJ554DRAFT_2147 [Olpidium bornovanus]|uniref:Uncharacterized protein n=1 Tax=Olpidium bornovanus TaxID=278681 RepID=A0A8H8DH59_9FUNG|nr:MAG: hypothetical protein BJ554DRAFT_2147 [Olpidium bornovanus]